MPDIQNIGPMDYQQMPIQQAPVSMPNEVNDMPMVYDPAVEEKRGGSSLLGYTAAILGTALVTYFATKHFNKKGAEEAVEELAKLRNSDAVKNYEKVKADYDGLKEAVSEIEKEADKHSRWKPWTWGLKKIKELLKPFKSEAKVVEKNAKKGEEAAENAAAKGKEAAEGAAEDAKKTSENA